METRKGINVKFNGFQEPNSQPGSSPRPNRTDIRDLWGVILTVLSKPDWDARKISEQFAIYSGGLWVLDSSSGRWISFGPSFYDNGNSGSSKTIDWDNAVRQKITLTAATATLSFTNARAGQIYTLIVVQDGSGSRAISWPTIKWVGAAAPTLTSAAGSIDIVSILYDGTNYYGTYSTHFA